MNSAFFLASDKGNNGDLEPCFSILQIDDWRDIAVPRDFSRNRRVRLLGSNALVTGFGNEYDALASNDNNSQSM